LASIVDGGHAAEELQSTLAITLRRFAEYQNLKGAFGRRETKLILMARHAIDQNKAFDMLREHSQRSDRKLIEVAEAIVQSHVLLPAAAHARRETAARRLAGSIYSGVVLAQCAPAEQPGEPLELLADGELIAVDVLLAQSFLVVGVAHPEHVDGAAHFGVHLDVAQKDDAVEEEGEAAERRREGPSVAISLVISEAPVLVLGVGVSSRSSKSAAVSMGRSDGTGDAAVNPTARQDRGYGVTSALALVVEAVEALALPLRL